jgi:hypothetical protein
VSYLALLRRSTSYTMHAWYLRVAALVIIAGLSILSSSALLAIALCLLASMGSLLLWTNERHLRRHTEPRFWLSRVYHRNLIKTDGVHRLSLGSYFELPEACVLVAIPCWVAIDDPLWARLIMLAAATGFFISTALLIFNDHTWFNPAEPDPPAWHEISRILAGPIVAGIVCAIALPAPWSPDGWWAALAISLLPLTINVRISDTDLIMRVLPGLVQDEAHAGRELVLSETHGALSTNLRLLEQQAREIRHQAPTLYDLAVSANSRLRETLTLSQPGQDSSTTLQNLQAPVMTLARAVGAKADVVVTVESLSPGDRDLARLVLNDLVGNALNAGAGDVRVTIAPGRPRSGHLSYRRRPPDGPGGMEDSGHKFGAAGGTFGGTLRFVDLRSGVEHQDGDRLLGGQ